MENGPKFYKKSDIFFINGRQLYCMWIKTALSLHFVYTMPFVG